MKIIKIKVLISLKGNLNILLWNPVFVPHILGGFLPVSPVAVNEAVQSPTALVVYPVMVSKSSLKRKNKNINIRT